MNDVRRVVRIDRAGPRVEARFDFVVRGERLDEATRGMKRDPEAAEFVAPSISLPLLELKDESARSRSGARDGLNNTDDEEEAGPPSVSRAKVKG